MHEEEDELCDGDPDTVLGRVRDIRRKWAVQEDEALAYKLQDEEIAQHYNSNRTRNAIVREDAPRAREAQRQEELQALEERLRHLNVLQRQAEEDARIAKIIASKDAEKSKKHAAASASLTNGKSGGEKSCPVSPKLSPPELMQQVVKEVRVSNELKLAKAKSPILGATASTSSTNSSFGEEPGPSRSCYGSSSSDTDAILMEDDYRRFQEEKDAAVARALQEEIDRLEKDKLLAIEAQDRELAKMLHEKERARYRRAKEKARLKAEAMAAMADRGETPDSTISEGGTSTASIVGSNSNGVRVASRNSTSSERSIRSTDPLPPRLPEKQRSPITTSDGDQIGFRAHPKPLPPHPPATPEFSCLSPSPQLQMHSTRIQDAHPHHHQRLPLPLDPVPPYMPIHGYNRNSPKRNK